MKKYHDPTASVVGDSECKWIVLQFYPMQPTNINSCWFHDQSKVSCSHDPSEYLAVFSFLFSSSREGKVLHSIIL